MVLLFIYPYFPTTYPYVAHVYKGYLIYCKIWWMLLLVFVLLDCSLICLFFLSFSPGTPPGRELLVCALTWIRSFRRSVHIHFSLFSFICKSWPIFYFLTSVLFYVCFYALFRLFLQLTAVNIVIDDNNKYFHDKHM